MVYYKEFLFEDSVDAVIVDDEYISFGGVGKEFYIALWDFSYSSPERVKEVYEVKAMAILKIKNAVEEALGVLKKNCSEALEVLREESEKASGNS